MKKLIVLITALALTLSLTACGGNPDVPQSTDSVAGTASDSMVVEPAATFPLSYPITWDKANIKHSENNPGGTLTQAFNSQSFYDSKSEVTIEYCKAQDDLFKALNDGKSDWPEFSDEWKGYGYSAIVNDAAKSARTFQAGLYGERHAKVIKDKSDKLSSTIANKNISEGKAAEGFLLVPNCMIEITETATIQQIADVAQQALYLQAWKLVPAESQGVLIRANGTDYTVEMILAEISK